MPRPSPPTAPSHRPWPAAAAVASLLVAVAVAGCAPAAVGRLAHAARLPSTSGAPATTTPGRCHARGTAPYVLPDPRCTPGAIDPAVTQATIAATICRPGYTTTVRPPESVTEADKRAGVAAYGESGRLSGYEEDHLVALELGGSPSAPANLWPEPGRSPNAKDAVESAAHRAVCDGTLPLAAAQQAVATDWVALGVRLGVLPSAAAASVGGGA
ncbi:MAG TPA: hypothetical protein VFP61_00880 [Acidimicrobiales bacterium]|nr:hypothetical protein [Acidimicrobiales bacterium]